MSELAELNIEVSGGTSTKLLTAGKYCDRNIVVIASGGSGGGGDLPEKAFLITGDCRYRFANSGWDWFIENYGDRVTTSNIAGISDMFSYSSAEEIPFDINLNGTVMVMDEMFDNCRKLKVLPKINGKIKSAKRLFQGCNSLRHIPEVFFENIDCSAMTTGSTYSNGNLSNIFNQCYSLRAIPVNFLKNNHPGCNTYNSYFSGGLSYCYSLDELRDLPLHFTSTWTNDAFSSTFAGCSRIKSLTFEMPDGQPAVMNWKNQTINLSQRIGYIDSYDKTYILVYNSGITADKEVTDDATYQALKNDPDWFTCNIAYSRYNHDSAVETINSLPDTSAYLAANGGTNTISFTGAAGSATDGGAINTLTEAEIAVAAAKGWTVSLV